MRKCIPYLQWQQSKRQKEPLKVACGREAGVKQRKALLWKNLKVTAAGLLDVCRHGKSEQSKKKKYDKHKEQWRLAHEGPPAWHGLKTGETNGDLCLRVDSHVCLVFPIDSSLQATDTHTHTHSTLMPGKDMHQIISPPHYCQWAIASTWHQCHLL